MKCPIFLVPLIPMPFFSSPTFMVRYLSSQIPSFLLFSWLRGYRSCFIFSRKKQKLVNLTCSMCFAGYEAPNLRYELILKSHVFFLFGYFFMMFDDLVSWGTCTFMFYNLKTFYEWSLYVTLVFMKKRLHVFSLIKLIQ